MIHVLQDSPLQPQTGNYESEFRIKRLWDTRNFWDYNQDYQINKIT